MKQSELNYLENTKKCVWVKWEDIEFYWESPSHELSIKGRSYDSNLTTQGNLSVEAKASDAKKAIVKWLADGFGV